VSDTTQQAPILAELVSECSHEDTPGEMCAGCGDPVDAYGNTANAFKYCTFPDCGCDGARLCMAGEASPAAMSGNVEGMWSAKTPEQRKGVFELMRQLHEEAK
jgi:hypothetical protein